MDKHQRRFFLIAVWTLLIGAISALGTWIPILVHQNEELRDRVVQQNLTPPIKTSTISGPDQNPGYSNPVEANKSPVAASIPQAKPRRDSTSDNPATTLSPSSTSGNSTTTSSPPIPEPTTQRHSFEGHLRLLCGRLVTDVNRSEASSLDIDSDTGLATINDLAFSATKGPSLAKGSRVAVILKGSKLFVFDHEPALKLCVCDTDEVIPIDEEGVLTKNLVLEPDNRFAITAENVTMGAWTFRTLRLDVGNTIAFTNGEYLVDYDGQFDLKEDQENASYLVSSGNIGMKSQSNPAARSWHAVIQLNDGRDHSLVGDSGTGTPSPDNLKNGPINGRILGIDRMFELRIYVG